MTVRILGGRGGLLPDLQAGAARSRRGLESRAGGSGARFIPQIHDPLGESGHSDRNPMANPTDSQTHWTLLERLAQSGGQNQDAWSEFVDRYGRKILVWCLRW